jgi:hypothetical protein
MIELAYSENTPRRADLRKKSNGFRATAWARRVKVSGHEKALLMVLASHANGDDEAFPHVETLANEIHASVRTTYRTLAKLEADGHIIRLSKKRSHGNVYRFPIARTAEEKHARYGTECHVRTDSYDTSDLPTVSPLNIKKELTKNYQRTTPITGNGFAAGKIWVDAQALPFNDDEDAESDATSTQGEGGGEVSLAFDEEADRAPIGVKPQPRQDKYRRGQPAKGIAKGSFERWESFVSEWGFIAGKENVDTAKYAFLRLSETEMQLAIEGAREMRIPPEKRCFAEKYISQKQWALSRKVEDRAGGASDQAQAHSSSKTQAQADRRSDAITPRVWINRDSKQWEAWQAYRAKRGEDPLKAIPTRNFPGNYVKTEWPPGHPMAQPAVSLSAREAVRHG